jgi:hypothetical protein
MCPHSHRSLICYRHLNVLTSTSICVHPCPSVLDSVSHFSNDSWLVKWLCVDRCDACRDFFRFMKNALLIIALLALTGCSTVTTSKNAPIALARSPTVFLRIQNDTGKMAGNISRRLESLGFKSIADADRANYFADVEYSRFFDVFHQTFNHFEIVLVDAKTGEQTVRSRYIGRVGFNGCDAALDLVFKDLSKKLKDGK